MSNPELQQIVVRGQGVQRGQVWNFDARANSVRYSAQTDGGDKECTWELDDAGKHDDVLPNQGAFVTVFDDDGPVWDGIFMRFEGDPWVDGAALAFVAEGKGVLAAKTEIPYKLVFKRHTDFRSAIQQAFGPVGGWIEALEPRIQVADSFAADSPDFKHRTPQEVLKAICSYASGSAPALRWHVRCNRSSGLGESYLEVFPYDTTPQYFVGLGQGVELHVTSDLNRVVNRVVVKWTLKHETEILSVATFESDGVDPFISAGPVVDPVVQQPTTEEIVVQDDYSIDVLGLPPFSKTIDATADIFDAQSAMALGHRHLAEFGRLRATGGSLAMDYGVVVRDRSGQQVPLHRIYPGVVIQIDDVTISDASYFGNQYPIVGVNWDEAERKVSLQLGELNTLDRQVLHVVTRNQTALTKYGEGVTGGIKVDQKNVPGGVAGLNYNTPNPKLDPAVIPHPLQMTVPFDVIVGLPVYTTSDEGGDHLHVGPFSLSNSFDFTIKGWRITTDAVFTGVIGLKIGPFTGFPSSDTGFSMFISGRTAHQEFSTVVPVAAGRTLAFEATLDGAAVSSATYLSIELAAERTL